jgi:hypothetical protein
MGAQSLSAADVQTDKWTRMASQDRRTRRGLPEQCSEKKARRIRMPKRAVSAGQPEQDSKTIQQGRNRQNRTDMTGKPGTENMNSAARAEDNQSCPDSKNRPVGKDREERHRTGQ